MTKEVAAYSEDFFPAKAPLPKPEPAKIVTPPKSEVEKYVDTIRPMLTALPKEKFIVLNPDGTKKFKIHTSGTTGGAIPKDWIGKLQGTEFVHNHPSGIDPRNRGFGTSLSPDDVFAASSEKMASIRALSAKREYIMRPGQKGWPTRAEILFEYNKADFAVRKKLTKRIYSGKIKEWQANQVHLHKVWKIVSKELDMRYSVVRSKK
jgi:hypothetical protein